MGRNIRVGSRESRLARIQSELAINEIKKCYPQCEFELITMKTTGDLVLDTQLDQIGGKGLFIKELDLALLEGKIDVAVHSLKDVPMQLEPQLTISAFLQREDPRDCLVLPMGKTTVYSAKPIGCSGQRRCRQLADIYPDWKVEPIRGNVITRLEKLDRGEYGALVLAVAGLKRLGLEHRIHRIFETAEILPAAGQGVLALVTRSDGCNDSRIHAVDHADTRCCALAERAFVRTLDGGCSTPLGVYAALEGSTLVLTGLYCPGMDKPSVRGSITGAKADAENLGAVLAVRLLAQFHRQAGKKGKVWLVGAGPGDAGLLTVKGAKVLQHADMVLFDKLLGKGVLSQIQPHTELMYVGKESGCHALPQEAINILLAKNAAEGKQVVRLKGGDPFVFGRGGEELAGLKAAGIPFEVIPGVSSAFAVPAYTGIPVSHRDHCSQVHVITGQGASNSRPIDYEALVKAGGTFIFLMGLAVLDSICQGLLNAGLDPDTPGAIIAQGTTARQRSVLSSVSRLPEDAKTAQISSPGLIIIGGVCGLSADLSWIESKPLAGISIGITCPRTRSSGLSDLLSAEGAEVVEIPTIRTALYENPAFDTLFATLDSREWLVFTSPTGVDVFFERLKTARRDIRTVIHAKFAAIGKATAAALEDRGILPDLVPEQFNSASLGWALKQAVQKDERVMLLRSKIGTKELVQSLAGAGIEVMDIPIYDTLSAEVYPDPAYRELLCEGLDWIAFTSASTVEGFAAIFGTPKMQGMKALCIGEQTALAAQKYGMKTYTATHASLESMVETLKQEVLKHGCITYTTSSAALAGM